MFAHQNVFNTFKSSLYVFSWSTMGIRRGRVDFFVFVFKRFCRGSTQRLIKTNTIFLLLRGSSFIVVVAIGGDVEILVNFAFEFFFSFKFCERMISLRG